MGIDPITLAVIRGSLEQVTDEMDSVFIKTAFSPAIAEGHDRADGIYNPHTGEVIMQGRDGLPMFVGVMQYAVKSVIDGSKELAPGDIFLLNDPYSGGTHLMDVKMVKPAFYRGELLFFLANTGHWTDVGGSVPGGFASSAREIYAEGLRITPVRLFRKGELNEDLFALIKSNIRVPRDLTGDLEAQVNALNIGAERLCAVLDKYGKDKVLECIEELKNRSEQLMRGHIKEIPDGEYSFVDYMDNDGVNEKPLKIDLTIEVKDSDIHLDFSKSDAPCKGPMNSVISSTVSACYIAIKHIFPDVPVNSGCFKPIHINAPPTTFLNATFPSPVSGCAAETTQRVIDAIFGALAKAIPDKVPAAPFATVNNLTIGGIDPQGGPYVFYVYTGGGYGGNIDTDGLTNGVSAVGISRTPPMEVYERLYPYKIRQFSLREESAGAGRNRGGFGVVIEFELLRGEAIASLLGDRGVFAPFGILGGKEARKTEFKIIRNGQVYVPPLRSKADRMIIKAGDIIRLETPGGGGYGDPRERDLARIETDLKRGYYSIETAQRDYGVDVDAETFAVSRAGRAK